jgi:uncharacterized protein YuzE
MPADACFPDHRLFPAYPHPTGPGDDARAMKITYIEDTDTALVEFSARPVVETRELGEDVYLDLDGAGRVVTITLEHASRLGDLSEVRVQRVGQTSAAGSPPPVPAEG